MSWGKGVNNNVFWGEFTYNYVIDQEDGSPLLTEDGCWLITEGVDLTSGFGQIYYTTWSGDTLLQYDID